MQIGTRMQCEEVRPSISQQVVVLVFSRASRQLDEALLNSQLARDALARGIDTRPSWAYGAKIFVDGMGPETLKAPCLPQLMPSHVVIYEEDEDDLMKALRQLLPYRIMKRKPESSGKFIVP